MTDTHTRLGADLLIIGIGNPLRRDDGAGPAVLRQLAATGIPAGVRLLRHHGEGLSLMEAWQGADRVLLIDAASGTAPAGAVHRFDVVRDVDFLPRDLLRSSSHLFGPAQAIEMGRVLAKLPEELRIIGIIGAEFGHGEGLSNAVARAVTQVAVEIRAAFAVEEPITAG